jgi:hypothetical protein
VNIRSLLKKHRVRDRMRLTLNRARCRHRATLNGLLERAELYDPKIVDCRALAVTCGHNQCGQ